MGNHLRTVRLETGGGQLRGVLRRPPDATDLVVLVSGDCGVAQASPEQELAAELTDRGMATLAVDLLTPEEASERHNRRDLDLLCDRLDAVAAWLDEQESTASLDVALYGTHTGAAAVLRFLDGASGPVEAVGLHNGRLDLVGAFPNGTEVPMFYSADSDRDFSTRVTERFDEILDGTPVHTEFVVAEERQALVSRTAEWFYARLHRAERSARQV
jgi:putative phosphoribosyl transferase